MSLSKDFQDALKDAPALAKALGTNKDLMAGMVQFQESLVKKQKESLSYVEATRDLLNKMNGTIKDGAKLYNEFADAVGNSGEQLRLNNLMADDLISAVQEQVALAVMQKTGLEGIYAQSLAQKLIEAGITDEKEIQEALEIGLLDTSIEHLKNRQEQTSAITKQNDLTKEIAATTLAIREEADKYKKSLDKVLATAQAIGNDPKAMGALMFTQGVKALGTFTDGFKEFQKQGLTAGQAIDAQFKGMDLMSMMGLSDVKGVTTAMIDEFGNVNALSRDTTRELGKMAVEFGISGEEAGKLNAAISTIPGETSESAANAMKMTGHLAEMQGIAPGKIMKDMAKSTGEMALYSKGGAEGFGKAAIELHKMGVEIGTAAKMADGLLDFETSINKQMEASVLLGREINFDKATELALSGDLEGSTAEVLKNIGGSAELDKMNVLQKKALAEAAGMTVEELMKAADAQEESNKYFGEGASLADNALGTMLKVGSAAGGFFKENGLLLMSTIQFLQAQNFTKLKGYAIDAAHWIKEKAHWAWKKASAALGVGGGAGGVMDKTKVPDIKTDAIDKTSKVKGTGGFKKDMQDMAGGLKALGNAKVTAGIGNLALFGLAAIPAIAGIPFMIGVAMIGTAAGKGMMGLADGLKGKGMGAALVSVGVGNLALFGLAAVVGVAGLPFMVGVAMIGTAAGEGMMGLADGLKALANPKVALGALILSGLALSLGASILMMGIGIGIAAAGLSLLFAELKDMPIENMLLMPIALAGMGVGLGLLAAAAYFAFPGLLLASFALGAFAAVLALMQPVMEMGGLQSLAEGLTALAGTAGGLSEVSAAVLGIGAGLGLMALAGLAALPIIGALMGLALVAPMLGKLGGLFGGGEDSAKDDGIKVVADKLDKLIAVVSQGGVINMDGKKVGDVIGLSVSNARIA